MIGGVHRYSARSTLGYEVAKHLMSLPIESRNMLNDSIKEIRRPSAELVVAEDWMLPSEILFNRISYSNLSLISPRPNEKSPNCSQQ